MEAVRLYVVDHRRGFSGRYLRPETKTSTRRISVRYVLDGDALFGAFAEAVRNRCGAGEIEPAVVVDISGAPGVRGGSRTYDFSPTPLSAEERTIIKDLGSDGKFGGSELCFLVIQSEIKPRVAELADINAERSTLFGWSLGGQFVVHSLFDHPEAFSNHLALSPSIWWNEKVHLKDLPSFDRKISRGRLRLKVYVGVGGLEQSAPFGVPPKPFTQASWAVEVGYARLVENARELARLLTRRDSKYGLTVKGRVFDRESHNSVPWAAVNPMLDFALPRQSAEDN